MWLLNNNVIKIEFVTINFISQLSSFVGDARTILSMLFFVKRLQAIQDFFTMCRQFASTMQGQCDLVKFVYCILF